jgi:hypothetical protein
MAAVGEDLCHCHSEQERVLRATQHFALPRKEKGLFRAVKLSVREADDTRSDTKV